MAESIIGKDLDNITNVAKGIDKEFLDMTYPDKYYRDVIQPAKLGQRPIPSKIEMLSKFQPIKAMGIGMRPDIYGERAKPTAAASKFLNTLGKGAKFLGTKVGGFGILDILTPTELGADDMVTQEMRDSIDITGINSLRGDYTRAPNTAFAELLSDPNKFDRSPASSGVRQTIGNRIKEGIGSVFDKIRSVSPTGIISNLLSNLNKFDDLSLADQDFITSQGLGKDKYGYNKRSMFGNYANLVKERAKIAADRRNKGLAQRAIDEYYEKLEKERQRQYEAQIQNAINEGRQMQQSYEDHFSNMGYSSPAERAADTPTGTLGRI